MAVSALGCATDKASIPPGHLPVAVAQVDVLLPASFSESRPAAQEPAPKQPGKAFELPSGLPGGDTPPLRPPSIPPNATAAEREKALQGAYPPLPPLAPSAIPPGEPITLQALQQMAAETNPSLSRARSDADAAYGAMVQAGLHPNPTVAYEADQVKPWGKPTSDAGQQGAYVEQLIKTAGKLDLAQQVAGYDYLNALVAVRRVQVDITGKVRTAYFSVLIAQQGIEINRSLVALADEVYILQRKQVPAGEAAAYEPLQLYAQAMQARNSLVQSEANLRSAWRQLAAAIGQKDLPLRAVAGRADAPPPEFSIEPLQSSLLERHTDLLTARNKQLQAQRNLRLQEVTPIPDVTAHASLQHDNNDGRTQYGLQIGIPLPLFDRNQGAIQQARAQIISTDTALIATQNDLTSQLAEAIGRYEANKIAAVNYRDFVLPNLTRAYRAMIRRYQVEPDKVGFNDIVVAQQNLAQALQSYLGNLDAQWKAVADIGGVVQLDDLYGK
jgi:cobalt-zinc-cadmium efflux system outer membrane protein